MKRSAPLQRRTPLKRGAPPKRRRRRKTPAEHAACEAFNRAVTAWPCWFSRREGHICDGPLDAHHLIPKDLIRRRLLMPDEAAFLAVLFNPLIGAPLCRAAHDAVERRTDHIFWEDLSPECIDYVASLPDFLLLRLEEESPKREAVSK